MYHHYMFLSVMFLSFHTIYVCWFSWQGTTKFSDKWSSTCQLFHLHVDFRVAYGHSLLDGNADSCILWVTAPCLDSQMKVSGFGMRIFSRGSLFFRRQLSLNMFGWLQSLTGWLSKASGRKLKLDLINKYVMESWRWKEASRNI